MSLIILFKSFIFFKDWKYKNCWLIWNNLSKNRFQKALYLTLLVKASWQITKKIFLFMKAIFIHFYVNKNDYFIFTMNVFMLLNTINELNK